MNDPLPFEQFRNYLCALAKMGLDRDLACKVDASDIAQQTLLQAHLARQQFRGTTDAECMAWLRQILLHQLDHCHRDYHREKRDVRREQSLQQRVEQSSWCLLQVLAPDQTSPLSQLVRGEQHRQLIELLSQLPPTSRDAILLKYWHGLTLNEIAQQLQLTPAVVAGMLYRGLKQVRKQLDASSPEGSLP